MADYISIPNAVELVESLRQCADEEYFNCEECKFVDEEDNLCVDIMISRAADAIEQLMQKAVEDAAVIALIRKKAEIGSKALIAENEKLKAERDAAVEDLKEASYCYSCKQCTERDGNECWCAASNDWSEWYDGCDAWEWRGVRND